MQKVQREDLKGLWNHKEKLLKEKLLKNIISIWKGKRIRKKFEKWAWIIIEIPKKQENSMKETITKTMLINTMRMRKKVDMKDMNSISKNKQISLRIKMAIIMIIQMNIFSNLPMVIKITNYNSNNQQLNSISKNNKITTIIITIILAVSLWIQMDMKVTVKKMEKTKELQLLLSRSEKILRRRFEFLKNFWKENLRNRF